MREATLSILRVIGPLLLLFVCSCPGASPGTDSSPENPGENPTAEAVRREFLHAWDGYMRYAAGHDGLRPVSKTPYDWYDVSLLTTPVDAYDTLLIMGLHEQAASAKQLIFEQLSFDQDFTVQVFEITIRSLGGLISAYQMDGDRRFLELAIDLADRLLPAFESPTGMPYWGVNLRTGETSRSVMNPAEIGTLTLEFGTLSKLTGNPIYYEKVKRGVTEVFNRRSEIGLVGSSIDVETGEWLETESHISGRIDSYYEYLLKAWLLFEDEDFREMWEQSISAVNRYLPDQVESGYWYGYADMNSGERTATRFGALDAFFPAVLALGGDIDRAERLMASCYSMWTRFVIEPEEMDYRAMEIVRPSYVLRPESIESAYYLFHFTGNTRYRDMGRTMFERIVEHTKTEAGFTRLEDITSMKKADRMDSFFLAETLKYAYLLFAPPDTLEFESIIFNTEAHPIRKTWD